MATTGLAGLSLAGMTGPAHAIFFGSSDDRYPYQASSPAPVPAITRPAKPKPSAESLRHKLNIERAEARKPNELKAKAGQGPLLLVVSIDQQKLVLYSNGEAIAESKVSTGVATHPTPTGIFSIIQRNRWHRSNIYSNAPMPYMQRITWSGVALHEGVVPGRPASHGCIRLPQTFAQQLWGTTKLGTRVIVTRGEVTPVEFSHPRLAALTRKSDPLITKQKDDAPKPAGETSTPPRVEPRADLQRPGRTQAAAKTRTAWASLIATDASGEEAAAPASPALPETPAIRATIEAAAEASVSAPIEASASESIETAAAPDSAETPVVTDIAKPAYPPELPLFASIDVEAPAPPSSTIVLRVSEYPPVLTADVALPQRPATLPVADYPPAVTFEVALPRDPGTFAPAAPFVTAEAADYPPPPLDVEAVDEPTAKPEVAAIDLPTPDYPPVIGFDLDANEPDPIVTASIAPTAKRADAPVVPAPVAEPGETEAAPESVPPSEGMIPGQIRAAVEIATVLEPYVKPGPVSVFISRKDRKLYVRQGFMPIFDTPIDIARPDMPLGTHIFTAVAVNEDRTAVRWNAISMPVSERYRAEVAPIPGKKGSAKAQEEDRPYPSAGEALERVTVPQELAERIFEHMAPGSSLIVSDQGLGPETGRGTDFIVLTR